MMNSNGFCKYYEYPIIIVLFLFFSLLMLRLPESQEQKESDRCLTCHTSDFGPTRKFQHPLIKEGQCLACHKTYDEQRHQESIKPVHSICSGCHDKEKMGRSHPIGNGIIDPNTNDIMTCISCHQPHGADFKYQLTFKNNMELCLSCHDF